MKAILISLLSIGWIEILDPQGYTIIIALSSMVKKRSHTLLYILVSYVTYALSGILIFLGIDRLLKDWLIRFCAEHPTGVAYGQLAIGIGCLLGFLILGKYLLDILCRKKELNLSEAFHIRSVHPLFIIGFAIVFTVCNMTGALAMVGFIAIMSAHQATLLIASIMLFLYALFSLAPKLVLYFLLYFLPGAKAARVVDKLKKIFNIVFLIILWLFLAAASWWGFHGGLAYLF